MTDLEDFDRRLREIAETIPSGDRVYMLEVLTADEATCAEAIGNLHATGLVPEGLGVSPLGAVRLPSPHVDDFRVSGADGFRLNQGAESPKLWAPMAEDADAGPVHLLVLCGAAGVGKSSVAFELSRLLAAARVAHALIDTDELDRVYPWPPSGYAPSELSRRNLEGLWGNYAVLGLDRLILVGVFVDLPSELTWIRTVVRGSQVLVVRLGAERSVLEERIRRREIGSGTGEQLQRTLAQTQAIADPPGVLQLDTSELDVPTLAATIFERIGWSAGPKDP